MRTMTSGRVRAMAGGAVLAMLLGACGETPAGGSGAAIVDEPESGAADDVEEAADAEDPADDAVDEAGDEVIDEAVEEDEPAAEEAADSALGTRDNPLDIGTRIEMGDWTVAVTEVVLDAEDAVMGENQFNDPPADGRQFVMFTVDATYEGDESGQAWLDFDWAIVGSAGNTFGSSMDDYCGVIPNSLDDTGETFPGGNVTGNVCVSVDSAQIDGATIRLEELFSFEDTRAFYAVS